MDTVIVCNGSTATEINFLTNVGIADICKVCNSGIFADCRIFDFHEVANLDTALYNRVRSELYEWSNLYIIFNLCIVSLNVIEFYIVADFGILDNAVIENAVFTDFSVTSENSSCKNFSTLTDFNVPADYYTVKTGEFNAVFKVLFNNIHSCYCVEFEQTFSVISTLYNVRIF